MNNFDGLPEPHSTPITPETVAKFDPVIQKILLAHAHKDGVSEQGEEPISSTSAQPPTKRQFPTFIEKSLPPEKED